MSDKMERTNEQYLAMNHVSGDDIQWAQRELRNLINRRKKDKTESRIFMGTREALGAIVLEHDRFIKAVQSGNREEFLEASKYMALIAIWCMMSARPVNPEFTPREKRDDAGEW